MYGGLLDLTAITAWHGRQPVRQTTGNAPRSLVSALTNARLRRDVTPGATERESVNFWSAVKPQIR